MCRLFEIDGHGRRAERWACLLKLGTARHIIVFVRETDIR